MNNSDSINKIISIIEEQTLKFKNMINPKLTHFFKQEKIQNGIIIHFLLKSSVDLDYMIGFTFQADHEKYLNNITKYTKLNTTTNPFSTLLYSDENTILSLIYDELKNIAFSEIACYEKLGIILINPLDIQGIFNINVKFNEKF